MVTISTSGSGSTTGAGGYALGTEANVTATPSAGYTLSHWEGVRLMPMPQRPR